MAHDLGQNTSGTRMNRLWLYGGLFGTIVYAALLTLAIFRLVQAYRAGEEDAKFEPLVNEQQVMLNLPGSMLLHGEGPRFTTAFGPLDFRLIHHQTGEILPMETIWFKSSKSTMSSVRLSLQGFSVAEPGLYVLQVLGLHPEVNTRGHQLVMTRDTRLESGPKVIAIVLSALGFLGCPTLTILAVIVKP